MRDRPRGKPSIRSRLMLLALLAVAPLLADRVRLLETSRSERLTETRAEMLDLARRARDAQVASVESTRGILKVLAEAYASLGAERADCRAFLTRFVDGLPRVAGLSIVGSDDRIGCSTRPQAIGLDLSDRDYVARARASGGLVLGDYLVERTYGTSAVLVAYPAPASGGAAPPVLLTPVELHWLAHVGVGVQDRPGAAAYLIDGSGRLLAGVEGNRRIGDLAAADRPLVRAVLSEPEGTVSQAGFDGARRIYGFARLPGIDATLVVGVDERAVLERISHETEIAYLHLAFFVVVTMMAAWLIGEHLVVEPIRALARTATRIGQGDLTARPEVERWASEFTPLATALTDMACRLSERERELRSTNAHLEALASIDALSGLANRRCFDARLAAAWTAAAARGQSLGLLVIDVDHFKLFNDRYGHVRGDGCLRQIGRVLSAAAAGPSDVAARWGGEEFVLLLPSADTAAARDVAERLRLAVIALRMKNEGAPLGFLTVSVGVAARKPGSGSTPDELIEAADAALYAAKNRGRNMVATDERHLFAIGA